MPIKESATDFWTWFDAYKPVWRFMPAVSGFAALALHFATDSLWRILVEVIVCLLMFASFFSSKNRTQPIVSTLVTEYVASANPQSKPRRIPPRSTYLVLGILLFAALSYDVYRCSVLADVTNVNFQNGDDESNETAVDKGAVSLVRLIRGV